MNILIKTSRFIGVTLLAKVALNCHSLQFEGMTALASYLEVSRRTMDGGPRAKCH